LCIVASEKPPKDVGAAERCPCTDENNEQHDQQFAKSDDLSGSRGLSAW
jgi:hypothetical protein